LIISFYFLRFGFSLPLFYFSLAIPRNAFIFQLLCLVPLCLLYVRIRYNKMVFYGFAAAYLFIVLSSEGRAGSIIIFLECLIAVYLLALEGHLKTIVRYFMIPIIILGSLFYLNYRPSEGSLDGLAEVVDNYNPRLATLIKGEGEGDLRYDK